MEGGYQPGSIAYAAAIPPSGDSGEPGFKNYINGFTFLQAPKWAIYVVFAIYIFACIFLVSKGGKYAILLPLLFIPTVALVFAWRKWGKKYADLNTVFLAYGLGTIPVVIGVVFLGAIIGAIWSKEDVKSSAETYNNIEFYAYSFFNAYFAAGTLEEIGKFCAILWMCRKGYDINWKMVVIIAASTAIGFATIEDFLYVSAQPEWRGAVVVAILRVLTPIHPLASCWAALNWVRRDWFHVRLNWIQVMIGPILLHGTWNFVLTLVAPAGEAYWVLLALLFNISMMISVWVYVRGLALDIHSRVAQSKGELKEAPPAALADAA